MFAMADCSFTLSSRALCVPPLSRFCSPLTYALHSCAHQRSLAAACKGLMEQKQQRSYLIAGNKAPKRLWNGVGMPVVRLQKRACRIYSDDLYSRSKVIPLWWFCAVRDKLQLHRLSEVMLATNLWNACTAYVHSVRHSFSKGFSARSVGVTAYLSQFLILYCFVGFLCHVEPSLAGQSGFDTVVVDKRPYIRGVSTKENATSFLDFAEVLGSARTDTLLKDIQSLEDETGFRLRVVTKSVSSPSDIGKTLKDLWKPDDKTVIVIEDISSPNILNFNAGPSVMMKLPRQFFLELQSRYGNQFFVQQEGEAIALISTVQSIEECLRKSGGCKNVPGLTNDLYYLTLATSIVGGCVFGFAARLPPSGRVEASWQWVLLLSPLWLFLFVSFGILPVIGRTSELAPLLKNALGFAGGAAAIYLTPIFGPAPLSK